ncbi:MAG: hypothetical protein OHK0036_01950 [Bacteroidia bacterium]
MYKSIAILILYLLVHNANAQSNIVSKDTSQIYLLVEKKKQYNRLNNGAYDGFRIKIFFDISKEKMDKVKSEFQTKYPDIPIYDDYIQPNFILTVGNFRTKLEAHEILKKIQADYPNAFIIRTKILP